MTKLQFIVLGVLVLFIGMCAMSTVPKQDELDRNACAIGALYARVDSLENVLRNLER